MVESTPAKTLIFPSGAANSLLYLLSANPENVLLLKQRQSGVAGLREMPDEVGYARYVFNTVADVLGPTENVRDANTLSSFGDVRSILVRTSARQVGPRRARPAVERSFKLLEEEAVSA